MVAMEKRTVIFPTLAVTTSQPAASPAVAGRAGE
jgi:hypothetical protein